MRHTTFKIALAGAALLIATTAFAVDFPVKAVRIVTPFPPPGGSVDLAAACVAYATWLDQMEFRDEARRYAPPVF